MRESSKKKNVEKTISKKERSQALAAYGLKRKKSALAWTVIRAMPKCGQTEEGWKT